MDSQKELAFLPVSITLSAWDRAVDRFSIAEWERRQLALIKAAQDAWNKRSVSSDTTVTFSLTLFVRLGEETTELTEYFTVKYDDYKLIITSAS
ncbi:Uncharacterised protein [Serratia fonticola]|uniref:Uncharacterized protein n=1 Tax=Serratia fonticola TaxID=47917 RepID=A0A0F7H833_SERFO|nr:hypothetical protein [Serratia fonticola]AKG68256.1 hypothetical protein WN53_03440 [Serratia fonticola]CAI1525437.1 Uncharacterised protein [Serratia fonticola]VTR59297.1 Uncharacterised protein [Serratia fonticola]